MKINETKRVVKKYYIRPQNVFAGNKDELLHLLVDLEDQNCTVYTLKNLEDNSDVEKLTNNDIIYLYDEGILYDKNRVRIMDYNLSIKNEEERDKIDPDKVSEERFADVYADRMTTATDLEEDAHLEDDNIENSFDLEFDDNLEEAAEKHTCCICGNEFVGYGNNPEPYASAEHGERCCDDCNVHYVLPARIDLLFDKEND